MANEDARYPFNSGKAENSISLQNRRSNSKIIIKNSNLSHDILCHAINNINSLDTLDTSYRNKNNIKDVTADFISYDSSKTIPKTNQGGGCQKKIYTQLSICRTEYQYIQKNEIKSNNSNNSNNNQKQSQTFFSKKTFKKENTFNNIYFKEINTKDKSENSINNNEVCLNSFKKEKSDSLLSDKNNDTGNQKNNFKRVSKLKKNILTHFKTSKFLYSLKNNIDKIEKNIFNKSVYKKAMINKTITNNLRRNKTQLKEMNNKMKFDKIKNKSLYKFKKSIEKDKFNDNKKLLLNLKCNNNLQIPKINTKLIMKNIQKLKLKKDYKKFYNENNIKKVIKIQSLWKGICIRKINVYFLNLNKFINIISFVIVIYNKKQFIKLLKENNKNKKIPYCIEYADYLNHFNSNLSIINNDKFIICKKPFPKKEYEITKYDLYLTHKRNIIKKICSNESINIIENRANDSKSRNNFYMLKKETQANLITEIKAIQRIPLFKDCIIVHQKNNINIINENPKINNNDNKSILSIINQNIIKDDINKESINLLSKINDNKLKEKKDFDEPKINDKKYKCNYEIDIRESLEINPIEMKRTKNNINNIFINNENKFEILNDKDSIMTEKAKINMMKIILPIKLKTVMIKYIKTTIFYILNKKLKYISFVSHLMTIDENYINNSKRYVIEEIKRMNIMYYKNYYLSHTARIKIYKLLHDYSIFKWNESLKNFAIFFLKNK